LKNQTRSNKALSALEATAVWEFSFALGILFFGTDFYTGDMAWQKPMVDIDGRDGRRI
jgi:hypothetical protein